MIERRWSKWLVQIRHEKARVARRLAAQARCRYQPGNSAAAAGGLAIAEPAVGRVLIKPSMSDFRGRSGHAPITLQFRLLTRSGPKARSTPHTRRCKDGRWLIRMRRRPNSTAGLRRSSSGLRGSSAGSRRGKVASARWPSTRDGARSRAMIDGPRRQHPPVPRPDVLEHMQSSVRVVRV